MARSSRLLPSPKVGAPLPVMSCRKTHLSFLKVLFLCLSRACLGKLIVLIQQTAQQLRFSHLFATV
jgi:hypothetical protein